MISSSVPPSTAITPEQFKMAPSRQQAPKNYLQEWFPNTRLPVIISAPMIGVSNGNLAAQVSKAGGFGRSPCSLHGFSLC